MRYKVTIYEKRTESRDEEGVITHDEPIYEQVIDDLDVKELGLFLNRKKRVRRKKEGKGE